MALQSINLTCTNCYGKLDFVGNGWMKCPFCGSSFFHEHLLAIDGERPSQPLRPKSEAEIEQIVQKAVRKYDEPDGWGVQISADGSPLEKDKKARKAFEIPDSETIYMIFDETMFGSCKEGFALTDKGLRLSYKESGPQFFPWSEFTAVDIKTAGSYDIILDGTVITLTGGDNRSSTKEMLKKIQDKLLY